MNRRRPRVILIVLLTVLLAAAMVITVMPSSSRTKLASFFGRVYDPVADFIRTGCRRVGDYFGAIGENRRLAGEITSLQEENAQLRQDLMQYRRKAESFDLLKDNLNLKTEFDRYTIVGGEVLNRSVGPMFDLFRINLGNEDGIMTSSDRSYPVLDHRRCLVGRIQSAERRTSRVLPLTHEAFAVSATIQGRTGIPFRVRGDLKYRDKGLCIADNFSPGTPVRIGDVVITSGAGGLFAEGIVIGEIIDVTRSPETQTISCVIKPTSVGENLRYVFVLTEKKEGTDRP